VLAQFFLRKHPDGRVAGQQAAGLNAVTLELPQTLDRRLRLDKLFLSAEATTFAGGTELISANRATPRRGFLVGLQDLGHRDALGTEEGVQVGQGVAD